MSKVEKQEKQDEPKRCVDKESTVNESILDIANRSIVTESGNVLKTDTKEYDWTQRPPHYNGHVVDTPTQSFEYETIDLIESSIKRWVSLGIPPEVAYSAGNAIKYLDRLGGKPEGGKTFEEKAAEELEKAAWYCTRGSEKMRKDF